MTLHRKTPSHEAARQRGRWCAWAGAVLLVTGLLAGCTSGGFAPMYAASTYGGGLNQALRSVTVTTIPGRVGQMVRNELVFQSTGGGEAADPKYRLDIVIRERVTSTLVNAQGDSASQIYELTATFRLRDLTAKQVVLNGQSFGRAGFERFKSIFSNVRAREDAEKRAARTVAHDIKGRLEAFLAGR